MVYQNKVDSWGNLNAVTGFGILQGFCSGLVREVFENPF